MNNTMSMSMSMSISKPSIFVALAFTVILLLTQCSFVQSDASFISKTCKQTPYYNLCVSFLKLDPRSSKADTTGLALIMVDIIKSKSTTTLNFIHEKIRKTPDLKKQLRYCAYSYNVILTMCIPEAIEALQKGNPKFAVDGVNNAAVEADDCEANFHGKSPMTELNKVIHDTSLIASAIIKPLL